MKQHITLVVSMLLLITCVIEVGMNVETLLNQEANSVLYIETDQGETPSSIQEDLLDFDYSIDDLPNTGS